jgi:sporulation protein YlmC with PRC-barrel domain
LALRPADKQRKRQQQCGGNRGANHKENDTSSNPAVSGFREILRWFSPNRPPHRNFASGRPKKHFLLAGFTRGCAILGVATESCVERTGRTQVDGRTKSRSYLSVAGAFSMADNLLFFTELVSMPVLDIKGRRIGRVKDAALVPVADAARIDRFLVGGGYTWLTVRADQIRSITLGRGIQLCDEQLLPYHDDEYMLRIGRDLLDQQIIDVTGRKVVRVTDVTMRIHHDGQRDLLTVIEVDIGLRSIFRRLAQGLLPPAWIRRLQQPIPPNSIRWEFANVLEPDPLRRLRLNISYSKLEDMHPADLADIVEELSPAEREAIFETIDNEVAADALSEIDPKMQASILESLEPEKAADIVEEMAPDEAADALSELQDETSEEILDEMDSQPKSEVEGSRCL